MDFYRSLSEHYDEIFPLKEPLKSFLADYVTQEKLKSILDIGCGTGTFALEISRMGLKVLGVDLSDEMIGISKKKAQGFGGDASFAVADMRDLSTIETEFEGVLCLGNTLAHVSSESELNYVIAEFLKKGTHLLVQTVNYDRMLAARIREFPVIKTSHLTFYRFYDYRPDGKIDFSMKIEFPDTKEVVSGVNILFPITSAVLKKALLEAGWEISGVWGNYEKAPWTENSPATIIAAKHKLVKE
ncbi:class I SAM-dependent methyltransferase [Desulfosporosinus meridiei]|uniref:Methyltransferase family protein n=1 Tax=Desulfosporosinus meridiei (strain ATCC BAA-275 / DSM 13257 / KCTC 12902 / NCIMB 13706 / S10) TaxID=768704 RepID=J7J0L1_DESMD|nr:class I SAM-dependent methyltransferase [Desulfosporosinus meridiei]AFQ44501.1 methyltransferase family protein [Desulfosporosinus meridiei DSM 13257]